MVKVPLMLAKPVLKKFRKEIEKLVYDIINDAFGG